MKRLALGLIAAYIFSSHVMAESVYDFLKREYKYDRPNSTQNIYAHNSHTSKRLRVTKFEVIFSTCAEATNWDKPDRVYVINKIISPGSDRHITLNARYPSSAKKRCYRLWAEFVNLGNNTSNNSGIEKILQKKKSGSQKLLEKIIGK